KSNGLFHRSPLPTLSPTPRPWPCPQCATARAGSRRLASQRKPLGGGRAYLQRLKRSLTATPTAAVVLALFAQVALIQLVGDDQYVEQIYGVQPHHLLLCDSLGLDNAWYEAPFAHKIDQFSRSLSRGVATPTRGQHRT